MKSFPIFLSLAAVLCGCTVVRVVVNNAPRPDDHIYASGIVLPRSASPVGFARAESFCWPVDTLLDDQCTCAFLVMQGDSLCYAYYDFGCCDTTRLCLFSVSKSFISTLIGIAVDQGYINSPDDLLSEYLPESAALFADSVTVRDLLNMRTGFRENGYATARLYYTPRMSREMAHMACNRAPGEFHYSSLCTQLLTSLLEKATRTPACDYLRDNLWDPLCMLCDGYVCTDSPRGDRIKGFSGICCTPMDAMKLSVLYRDGGEFMGRRIVSEQWIDSCLNPGSMSMDKNGACYNYHWYVLEPGREFFAKGLFGQYLYVNRDTDTVIARFGIREGATDWIDVFRTVASALGGPQQPDLHSGPVS